MALHSCYRGVPNICWPPFIIAMSSQPLAATARRATSDMSPAPARDKSGEAPGRRLQPALAEGMAIYFDLQSS
jgi:hypothetical protein